MDLKNLTVEQLPVVLTIYEISKIMKVDVSTVLELIELKKIEPIKGIEKPRITSLSLINFLCSNGNNHENTHASSDISSVGLIKEV